MAGILQNARNDLTEVQIRFLSDEFTITPALLFAATEEQLDEIYDTLCDIEIDETVNAGNGELSERGRIASDIVTIFGNAIAEAEGYFDDERHDSFWVEM